MNIKDIQRELTIERLIKRVTSNRGLKILGASKSIPKRRGIRIFRPLRLTARFGKGRRRGQKRGRGFGMIAASVPMSLISQILSRLCRHGSCKEEKRGIFLDTIISLWS